MAIVDNKEKGKTSNTMYYVHGKNKNRGEEIAT